MPKVKKIYSNKTNELEVAPSDFNQAIIRFVVVSGLLLWSLYQANITRFSEIWDHDFVVLTIGYWIFSVGFLVWCRALTRNKKSSHLDFRVRRIVGVVADLGAISAYTAIAGTNGLILYPIYLTTIIGYGYRFGSSYLYLSIVCGLVGFSLAISVNRSFAEISLVIAYYIGLILVPLYSLLLLKRHERVLLRLKQVNESRARFIANMSHELRTPLHAIINVNEVLKEKVCNDAKSAQGYDQFNMIGDSAEHLLTLVNRVLDIASSDAKSFNKAAKTKTSLYESIKKAFNIASSAAIDKGIQPILFISPSLPSTVNISRTLFEEVLINIIGNAVKYTDDGYVHAHFTSTPVDQTDSTELKITVTDSGAGIPESLLPNIFEPFTMGDDTRDRKHSGTGLGLTITRQYVENLGGTIGISSIEGVGSKIEISIPISNSDILEEPNPTCKPLNCLVLVDKNTDKEIYRHHYFGINLKFLEISGLDSGSSIKPGGKHDAILVAKSIIFDERLSRGLTELAIPLIFLGKSTLQPPEIGETPTPFRTSIDIDSIQDVMALHDILVRKDETSKAVPLKQTEQFSILVADDNEINQRTAQLSLESVGHKVELANDGEEALQMLSEGNYDLVLMDMHMPRMDGIEAAKLHTYETETPTPIILLTADASELALEEAKEADVTAFLTKPIRPDELRMAVARYAKKSAATQKVIPLLSNENKESTPTPRELERIDLIDTKQFNELIECGATRSELIELLQIFDTDSRSSIKNALEALSASKLSVAQESMHALKGGAVAVGATALGDKASQLEAVTSSQVRDFEARLTKEVPNLLFETVNALRDAFQLADDSSDSSEFINSLKP